MCYDLPDMRLYLVLHHRRDPDQPWSNDWIDDDRIRAITTTARVGNFCEQEKQQGRAVFVHRCAYGGTAAVISCAAEVDRVDKIGDGALVTFVNPAQMTAAPPGFPPQGTRMYTA